MSGEEQGGVNRGELYTPGIRPLPFDPGGPGPGSSVGKCQTLVLSSLPHPGSIFFCL